MSRRGVYSMEAGAGLLPAQPRCDEIMSTGLIRGMKDQRGCLDALEGKLP